MTRQALEHCIAFIEEELETRKQSFLPDATEDEAGYIGAAETALRIARAALAQPATEPDYEREARTALNIGVCSPDASPLLLRDIANAEALNRRDQEIAELRAKLAAIAEKAEAVRECDPDMWVDSEDLRIAIKRLLAAVPQSTTEGPWQPIETAPMDGTTVLVWGVAKWLLHDDPSWYKASFRGDFDGDTKPYWHCWGAPGYVGHVEPTHWMPLPKPPSTSQQPSATGAGEGPGEEKP